MPPPLPPHRRKRNRKPSSGLAKSRVRGAEAKQELREHILMEATRLFVEQGYADFSMRKLADRIGYTAPAIYSHFPSKEELLAEVISGGYERLRDCLQLARGPALRRLRQIGEAYLNFAFAYPELYRLMFMTRPKSMFDLDAERVAQRTEGLRVTAEILGEEPLKSRLRPLTETEAADAVWAFVHGLASLALTVPLFSESWARKTLDAVLTVLEAGLSE